MKKKTKILIIILFIIIGASFAMCLSQTDKKPEPFISTDIIYFNTDNYKLLNENYFEMFDTIDEIKEYTLNNNYNLKIVNRKFINNDYILFYEFVCNSVCNEEIFTLEIKDDFLKKYNLNKYENEKEFSTTFGFDKTSLPTYYIELNDNSSLLISKIYKSNILKYEENFEKSTVRELMSESSVELLNKSTLKIQVDLELDQLLEGWILVSNEKLFENEIEIQDYTNLLNSSRSVSPWLTVDGQYTKIPYSIRPFTREGYARNPGSSHGKQEFYMYQNTKKPIYYNLVWNKILSLYRMPRHFENVWYTEYTSTYISNPYGVVAPFVDTRHNENITQFLRQVYNEFDVGYFKDAALYYPNYIISEVGKNNIISLDNELFLIPDYFFENESQKTHASLNHQLGTANVLLESYKKTNNENYLDTGLKIINGIAYLGEKWIRDSGDLWYMITPDLEFKSTDYETLTLNDLLIVQETLESIGKTRISVLDKLIISKYKYVNNNNITLSQELNKRLIYQGFKNSE